MSLLKTLRADRELVRTTYRVLITKRHASSTESSIVDGEEEFRVLELKGHSTVQGGRKKFQAANVPPPRTTIMPTDQDWTNVWPGPRSFHPASVPLPLRQGMNKLGAAPGKIGNAELMKIPNFLHLTPPAIKKHCEALKKFCTPWPKGLETDEECDKHFPMEVISTDYCHSAPTIRNPLSRIVTIKVPLKEIPLNDHAKDKFLRLMGERYEEKTGIVTITTDKCPLRNQNYDYAMYLLTAVLYESWKFEPWEKEKTEEDMEFYDWDNSRSKENLKVLFDLRNEDFTLDHQDVQNFKEAVVELFDKGETEASVAKYKKAAKEIIFS